MAARLHQARSVATCRCPTAKTWSTGQTPQSQPSVKSRSGSRIWANPRDCGKLAVPQRYLRRVPYSSRPVILGSRLAHLLEASDHTLAGHDLPRRSLAFDTVVMVIFVAMGLLMLQVFSPRAG